MAINLSALGGSGGLPKLAPDLTFPSDKLSSASVYKIITVPVTAATETTTLTLTGKWAVNRIWYTGLVPESMNFYMEVDGIVIWNDSVVTSATQSLYGFSTGLSNPIGDGGFTVNSSMILKITTTTDTSVDLNYLARPIL